jgi:hypothetical protein
LADVFLFAAGKTDASTLEYALIALPFEDSEGSETDPAFLAKVLFEHPDEGVFSIAAIAGDGEICRLPALFVDACPGG